MKLSKPASTLLNGVISLGILVAGIAAAAPARAPAAGKVLAVKGKLSVNGKTVTVGAIVHQGDKLLTSVDSRADIGFSDGSVIELGAGSRLMVSDLGKKTSLMLQSGSILNLVHQGTEYHVTTPRVVAAVRGTVFYLEASSMKPNYACICKGTVELQSTGKEGYHQVFTTKTHTAFLINPDKFEPTMLWGHTDEDITRLESYEKGLADPPQQVTPDGTR